MEAMASGLPCVASKIRGNVDLISGEYLFNPLSDISVAEIIRKMMSMDRGKVGELNKAKIQKFDINRVQMKMKEVYSIIQDGNKNE